MRPGLLLVDIQQDYLSHPALVPGADTIIENVSRLLAISRSAGIPVFHSHTVVCPDGSNRMPHWKRKGKWACMEGTDGVNTPPALSPAKGEKVFAKPFYSALGNAELTSELTNEGITHLIVGGLYTHACVQATVLEAYQAGFEVWVAEDCVASYDALHAGLSRAFMETRACSFASVDQLCAKFGLQESGKAELGTPLLAGRAGGNWLPSEGLELWAHHLPGEWGRRQASVPIGTSKEIDKATVSAIEAQHAWSLLPLTDRAAKIHAWALRLEVHKSAFAELLAQEIGKPLKEGMAEIDWAIHLARATADRAAKEKDEPVARGVLARHRPLGVVGLITPWNNPVAIPVGKLAPALAYGNTVVWKPALPSPDTSLLVLQTMDEAGIPASCVNLVFGDAHTGRELAQHRGVAALSFTGSSLNGKQLAALCAVSGKSLQAELGGNNAVVIMDSKDPVALAKELAQAMFSFAGQRCTAPRRLIVANAMQPDFKAALIEAIESLRLGDATNENTEMGPLISREAQSRMGVLVEGALQDGARLLCGGSIPEGMDQGCWFKPTLLEISGLDARVAREEAFGPVAVWQEVSSLDDALVLCNGVEHGLVATLVSDNPEYQKRFLERAEAGILRINQLSGLHPDAPFPGWKASGLGAAEHGPADRLFYTRMQSVYG